jgi:TPR repeat protein
MENVLNDEISDLSQLDQETNKDPEKDEIDNSIKFRIDFNNKHCLICNQALEIRETQFLPCEQHQCHVICKKKMKRHLIEECCPVCTQFEEPEQKIYHLTLISFLRFEDGINDNRIFNCLQQEKCTLNYNLFLNFNYDKFPQCSYFLGLIKQYTGYTGFNLKEAIDWFTTTSETDNHKMSQLYLGLIYLEKHNFDLAYKYLLRASRQKVGQAQFNLGKMYIDGQIKSTNRQIQKQEGFYWINESIQNLDHEDYLGRVIIFGDASNWVTEAEFLLGVLLKKGIGTIQDFNLAEKNAYQRSLERTFRFSKRVRFFIL